MDKDEILLIESEFSNFFIHFPFFDWNIGPNDSNIFQKISRILKKKYLSIDKWIFDA